MTRLKNKWINCKKINLNKTIQIFEKKPKTDFRQFQKLDIRIGQILQVEKIPNHNNFFKLKIDIGFKKIIVVCNLNGIKNLKQIIGKKVCVLANIKPKKVKGQESQGLILLVKNNLGKIIFLEPDSQNIKIGLKVY